MTVLLLGANGFLGRSLQVFLHQQQVSFKAVGRNGDVDYAIDLSSKSDYDVLPNNTFDVIVNCASALPAGHFLDAGTLATMIDSNVIAAQNLCDWTSGQSRVKKIINCSTLAVVNKPWDIQLDEKAPTYPLGNHVLYAGSKLFQELILETYAQTADVDVVQLRFSALYGSGMKWAGVLAHFINSAKTKNRIDINNGNLIYADFLHVKDACQIVFEASRKEKVWGIYNAASGQEVSLLKLAETIQEVFSPTVEIYNTDTDILPSRACIDVERLKSFVNVDDFISLKEGVREIIEKGE